MRGAQTLEHVSLFRSLDRQHIDNLNRRCSWRRYEAGREIVGYEDIGTDVFFVASGRVRVRIQTEAGREIILRDIDAGEWFGELAAIDGAPRSAAILALTGTTLARMPADVFRSAVHRHPDVCDQLLALLTSQIRMLVRRVTEQTALDVPRRVRAELLRLAGPSDAAGRAVISPPPFHAEIAGRVGCKREAVTREIGRLSRAGLIERKRGAFVITDCATLAQLARPPED